MANKGKRERGTQPAEVRLDWSEGVNRAAVEEMGGLEQRSALLTAEGLEQLPPQAPCPASRQHPVQATRPHVSHEAGEPGRATYLAELRSLDFNHTSKTSALHF